MMSFLNVVNRMFSQKEEIDKMSTQCSNSLYDQHQKFFYYLGRVKTITKGLLIYGLIVLMIYLHTNIETNVINWIFFSLQMTNLALIIKGMNSIKEIKLQIFVISIIKNVSFIILALDIFFITLFGELPGKTKLDTKFKETFPFIYNNLEFIGFRSNEIALNDIRDRGFARK